MRGRGSAEAWSGSTEGLEETISVPEDAGRRLVRQKILTLPCVL